MDLMTFALSPRTPRRVLDARPNAGLGWRVITFPSHWNLLLTGLLSATLLTEHLFALTTTDTAFSRHKSHYIKRHTQNSTRLFFRKPTPSTPHRAKQNHHVGPRKEPGKGPLRGHGPQGPGGQRKHGR